MFAVDFIVDDLQACQGYPLFEGYHMTTEAQDVDGVDVLKEEMRLNWAWYFFWCI